MTNDEIIAVVAAHSNGKQIASRWRNNTDDNWVNTDYPGWVFNEFDYKVVSREYWVNVYPSGEGGSLYDSKRSADEDADSDRIECLHLIEVE